MGEKIYILKINNRDKYFCRTLEIAKRKMEELKDYYKYDRRCEILNETEMSFESFFDAWDAIHNYIRITEIVLEE